jgi:hypothetical protein
MPIHARRAVLLASCLWAAISCDTVTAPDPGPRDANALFQTGSLEYTLRRNSWGFETIVDVVFMNSTSRTAHFLNCRGGTHVRLEKLVDDAWKAVWNPVLLDCLSAPISVEPGQSTSLSIWVAGSLPGTNHYPQFQTTELSGIYRLAWFDLVHDYQASPPWGEPLPEGARISNRFAIRHAPF